MMEQNAAPNKLTITGPINDSYQEILSEQAIDFLQELVAKFSPQRELLLATRETFQQQVDNGQLPDFLPETTEIRNSTWEVAPIPADLLDRRVEITGPPERKMVINALNAKVKVFMADFEDSLAPTWDNILQGQINLRDAVKRQIDFTDPNTKKQYQLAENPAILMCRVRGLHLPEKHITYEDCAIPACLLDFALYFFHNHKALLEQNTGPYFYIPKLQHHLEAKWWNDIFTYTEDKFGLERGTIKATVLIETLPAVFQMDEILYQLRDHIVGLNCGRWDYIFSYIKTLRNHPERLLPDRHLCTMEQSFLSAYSRLLIKTCHQRGALAMGGMAAFIPVKDPQENKLAIEKVRLDKRLEVANGHDGTWIAHPGLADTALVEFATVLSAEQPNQLHVHREQDPEIKASDLLTPPEGGRSEADLRHNIRIALYYIESWISGTGCVPIYNLMEDAATAEISRALIWQWRKHQAPLDSGLILDDLQLKTIINEELENIVAEVGKQRVENGKFKDAVQIVLDLTSQEEFTEFLTLPCYELIQ